MGAQWASVDARDPRRHDEPRRRDAAGEGRERGRSRPRQDRLGPRRGDAIERRQRLRGLEEERRRRQPDAHQHREGSQKSKLGEHQGGKGRRVGLRNAEERRARLGERDHQRAEDSAGHTEQES